MDGSLRADTHQDAQTSKTMYRDEKVSNSEVPDRFNHYHRGSPGARPLSLDAASDVHLKAGRASTGNSPELSLKREQNSQDESRDEPRVNYDGVSNSVGNSERSAVPPLEAWKHMRPFTNPPDVKHMSGLDAAGRRRSQSIGSGPRGSRIAALSVQLRTRLSHAAARIEKKRQSQSHIQAPTALLQKNSSTPILSVETLSRTGQPLPFDDQRLVDIDSPNGTTISAPDASAALSPHTLEAPLRPSLGNTANDLYPQPQPDLQKSLEHSSDQPPYPRLAPPVDIGSSGINGHGPRRRPNPNISGNSSRYSPFPLHKRGRSQQDFKVEPDTECVPETPPLRPSTLNLGPYNTMPDNSQSSSMEQDAIETLLFMSSPGTSGYHSASQNSQRNQDMRNIDSSASQNTQWRGTLDASQSSSKQSGSSGALHIRAGDDIDRMLDQMNSDSDDDVHYNSARSNKVKPGSRAPGTLGHHTHHGT